MYTFPGDPGRHFQNTFFSLSQYVKILVYTYVHKTVNYK
jgi:hypothetical protein